MNKFANKILQFLSFRVIGRQRTRSVLLRLFKAFDFDMLQVAHNEMGINNYGSNEDTGEAFFLEKYLVERFGNEAINLFDVGANVGEYSLMMHRAFPLAKIYTFEPNPVSFEALKNKTILLNNIHPVCAGLGAAPSTMEIYTYKNDKASEHASLIKDVMVTLHDSDAVESYEVDILSLDNFCSDNAIKKIHFLKIDTEGFELEVLKGATNLIHNRAIEIIQFEFNEMNIYSRVFLQDFYNLLPHYDFFRLATGKLIPLGKYNSSNEVFMYQNIVALLNQ